MLTDALEIIEAFGVKDGGGDNVLEVLGYSSIWEGMDMNQIKITKNNKKSTTMTATTTG
jgi:hypothetical protein